MGVIVAGLEVIEVGFEVVDIATITEGVILVQSDGVGVGTGTGAAGGVAPSVVGISYYRITICVQDGNDISLEVYRIEVCRAIEVHSQGCNQCVITNSLRSIRITLSGDIGDRYRSPVPSRDREPSPYLK